MSKRLGVIALMLLLIASCAVVSANEQTSDVKGDGTIIQPVTGAGVNTMSILSVSGTITQGVTKWQTKLVSSYITSMNVDLNWGNPSNSLQLRIYSPTGAIYGPFYDNYDGVNDGRINLNVINSAGVPQGTWSYEIYGYRVNGVQTYTI
jgi:hypothetical protein